MGKYIKKTIGKCSYNQLYSYNVLTPRNKNILPNTLKMFLQFYPGGESIKDSNQRIKVILEELRPEYTNMEIEVYCANLKSD